MIKLTDILSEIRVEPKHYTKKKFLYFLDKILNSKEYGPSSVGDFFEEKGYQNLWEKDWEECTQKELIIMYRVLQQYAKKIGLTNLNEAIEEKRYNKYELYFIIKSLKDINRTFVADRIRAIPYVTVVDLVQSDKLDQKNSYNKIHNYFPIKIKFLTPLSAEETINSIKHYIMTSNNDIEFDKIKGIVGIYPRYDTIQQD